MKMVFDIKINLVKRMTLFNVFAYLHIFLMPVFIIEDSLILLSVFAFNLL